MYYTRAMKQARISRPAEAYCSQHHQPRAQCDPRARHTQPLRCSDELFAAVEARAAAMGMDRNAGIEAALEEWVRDPGDALAAPPGSVKFSGDTGAAPAVVPVPDRAGRRGSRS